MVSDPDLIAQHRSAAMQSARSIRVDRAMFMAIAEDLIARRSAAAAGSGAREAIARLVWADVAAGGVDLNTADPEEIIDQWCSSGAGLAAVASGLGLGRLSDEVIEVAAWRGRELWAAHHRVRAARAASEAGCSVREIADGVRWISSPRPHLQKQQDGAAITTGNAG